MQNNFSLNDEKPIWDAPERNKDPILQVLSKYTKNCQFVLEVGSGTGQHAVHFAKNLPHIHWQCTDQLKYIYGIKQWIKEAKLPNLATPQIFDVNMDLTDIPSFKDKINTQGLFDCFYTANTLHIMSWEEVENYFSKIPSLLLTSNLKPRLIIYGPFNNGFKYTSESNALFDKNLKEKDKKMGIRDLESVIKIAKSIKFNLIDNVNMPVHNQCLIFEME